MARKPQVRYWQRKGGGFFTTIDGTQHELALGPDDSKQEGPTYKKALQKYTDLICQREPADALTVQGLVALYRDAEHDDVSAANRKANLSRLASFVEQHGTERVADLVPIQVNTWLKGRTSWGRSTRRLMGTFLLSVINWGVRQGAINSNPLTGRLALPQAGKRGKEARLTPAFMDAIEGAIRHPATALYFALLRQTGCRPVELREATADRYSDGWIVHPWDTDGYRWKNAKKTEKDRIIFIPDELVAQVDDLARKHPTGPLFRTPRGKAWTQTNLTKQWYRLLDAQAVADHMRDKGIKREDVTPYCYRHTFISDWMDAGRSAYECAELCGTSVKMIERVYGHSDARKIHQHYRDFLAGR
jgi:integrase